VVIVQPSADDRRWFAVYTRCHHEEKVIKFLNFHEFTTLLPKRKVYSRRRDRRKIIDQPVFPGYAFVELAPEPRTFTEVLKTPGVVYILGKPRPIPIPAHEIESLQIMVAANCELSPCAYFRTGERVRVVSGPLTDAEGYIAEILPKKRMLVVSVDILCRSVTTQLYDYEVARL
jgi:transcription antitermination factor NusG